MDQIIRIGMDTSKQVFQLHGVNTAEQPVLRKKLRRKDMVAFFKRLAPTMIAIEACGASHQWARRHCHVVDLWLHQRSGGTFDQAAIPSPAAFLHTVIASVRSARYSQAERL